MGSQKKREGKGGRLTTSPQRFSEPTRFPRTAESVFLFAPEFLRDYFLADRFSFFFFARLPFEPFLLAAARLRFLTSAGEYIVPRQRSAPQVQGASPSPS